MCCTYKRWIFLLLVFLIGNTVFSQQTGKDAGTRQQALKSFFLLRFNLTSDPVDLQNYLSETAFKSEFKTFSVQYAQRIARLKANSASINWAISSAINGDLDASLKNLENTLASPAALNDKELLSVLYLLKSHLLTLKRDYSGALLAIEASMALAQQTGWLSQMARLQLQKGKIFSLNGQTERAEAELIRKALPAFTNLKNQEGVANCYREIADMYLRNEQFSPANWFYLQALSVSRKVNYSSGAIGSLNELAQLKFEIDEFASAEKDWLEAEKLAIHAKNLPELLRLKFNLNQLYRKWGKTNASEKYAMEFEQLKDILLNPVL